MLTALMAVLLIGLAQTQAPTPEQVSGEIAALIVIGLGALGSAIAQAVKRAVTPLNNASATIKMVVIFGWGLGLAWVTSKVPWLGHALPADPTLLGDAVNGLLLTAIMTGVHSIQKVIQKPASTDLSA